jgi:hypothetical protein
MSQRRPPDDESDREQAEGDRADGLRSQTRPAAQGAPGKKQEWGMTKPLDSEGLGARPTPMRPEPGRAFVRGEPTPEPAVRVGRNVYAGTAPQAAHEEPARPAPRAQPATSQRPQQAAASADRTRLLGGAEPLRDPSNRPAPAPFQANRQSAKATLLMTDSSRSPAQPSGRAQAPAGVSVGRHPGGTLPVEEADIRASTPAVEPARAAADTKGPGRRAPGSSAPVPQSSVRPPQGAAEGDRLQLQLDAGDMLEQPVDVGPPEGTPGRSPAMLIAVVLVLVVVAGAGIWYGMSGSSKPAAELPPTRNDMQPATTAPVAVPTAVPAATTAAPGTPAPGAVPAAAATTAPATAAPAAAAQPEVGADGHGDEPAAQSPAAAPKKADARPSKRRRGGKASGPVSPDVAAAREALRELQSGGPVLRVQPSEEIPAPDEGPALAPPPPPEPPPPDPGE